MAPECVQVKIEIGHKSVCRTALTKEGFTHDWIIFVRGAEGSNISHFVDRVVFYLHESFPKPRRVIKDPPYKVAESGYGSFLLPVEIYFKNKDEPKKVRFEYDLYLQLVGNPPVNNVRVEALTFSDPVEDFKKKLLKAGGVVVPSGGLNNSVASPPALPPVPPVTKAEVSGIISTTSEPTSGAVKKPKSSPSVPAQVPSPSVTKSKPKESLVPHGASLSIKRPSSLDDNSGTPKVKKKKVDRSEENAAKPVPKEISILSPQVNSSEKEKIKTKMTLPGVKKVKETKERKKSFDAPSTTPTGKSKIVTNGVVKEPSSRESPGKEVKSREAKIEKLKKDKSQKKLLSQSPSSKARDELPKVQKLTVKRKSGDAWASSSAPGFNVLSSGKNSKKDTKLDELIAEFANESSSDDEDGDTSPPFVKKDVDRHLPLSNGDVHQEEIVTNLVPVETKLNTAKTKKNSKGKTIATLRSISSHNNNNINKLSSVKKNDNPSPQNGKTRDRGMSLKDLYDRICSIEDSVLLQKVVDIVEGTGLFEVTDTTFDFDLCQLDPDTISKLEESVLITA